MLFCQWKVVVRRGCVVIFGPRPRSRHRSSPLACGRTLHARSRWARERGFGSAATDAAPIALGDEHQLAARCARRPRASPVRQTAQQCRRFGGHVRVLSPHGPLERLHLTQLECESEQEVAGTKCAPQLPQRFALRNLDCRCAVRGQLLEMVAASRHRRHS